MADGLTKKQAWNTLLSGLSEKERFRYIAADFKKFGKEIDDLIAASRMLDRPEDIDRVLGNSVGGGTKRRGGDVGRFTEGATRFRRIDAALTARRQQREGMGVAAQSGAIRRAIARARGRDGTSHSSGPDEGRKTVLGGGV